MATAPNQFVLRLNNVYISTLTDLNKEHMIKMDVNPGVYQLIPYFDGYVFTTENYNPNIEDLIKIFNTRDCDKGLSGTYHDGASKDANHLRLLNKYILHQLPINYSFADYDETDEKFDDSEDTFDETTHVNGTKFTRIPHYHNLPVIFFLTQPAENLNNIDMEMAGNLNEDVKVWNVKNGNDFIGYAVQSKKLICMMGDQAGIGVFAGARAFGNFQFYNESTKEIINNIWSSESDCVFDPDHKYVCDFKPCHCDVNYCYLEKKCKRCDYLARTKH